MLHHISFGVRDLELSGAFYDAALGALKQDEMSLNHLLVPFVTAEAGTQSLAEFSAPGFPLSRE
jgi:catechol 2,3-dioxygenase-like lactoylglutathione lyase family enzyme